MARLTVFENVSLDGYFTDAQGKMDFAHSAPHDAEWNEFSSGNARGGGALLFGRVTYEMMAAFWPTPAAAQMMPVVLGKGRTLFEGVENPVPLKLVKTRAFGNGNTVLWYKP